MGNTEMDEKSEALELYKVMISTITANELRRQQISYVFITLIGLGSAGVGAIGNDFDPLYVAVPGILLSLIWWSQISYLKQLATAKWDVVGQLEQQFSTQPFAEEWRIFKKGAPRSTLSEIEMFVPLLCLALCVGYIGWEIYKVISNFP